MSAQHTPGPWHVVHEKDGTYAMAGDFYIAETFDSAGAESDETTQYANARLIAAAPDLLEALRGIRAFGPEHFEHLEGLIAERDQLLDALKLCQGNISSLLASTHPKVYGEWLAVVSAAIDKATVPQGSAMHV